MPPLESPPKAKQERNLKLSHRALADLDAWTASLVASC
jgi:hypothetical protein